MSAEQFMSAAARKRPQRQAKQEKDPNFQKKENERLRLLRNANWSKLSGSKLNELRKKPKNTQDMQREKEKRNKEKTKRNPLLKLEHAEHLNHLVKPPENLLCHCRILQENEKQLLEA